MLGEAEECLLLDVASLVVAEVGAIGDDDVIHEMDAHQLAGLLELTGQLIVIGTGA